MTLVNSRRDDRVMVFIDLMNMELSVKPFEAEKFRLDYPMMVRELVGERDLVGAYVFDTGLDGGQNDKMRPFHDKLSYQGFRVMTRDSYDPERKEQKEIDVAMACEMVTHALQDHYDVAIVVSGDGDFVPAIQHVQSAGKMVEVASFSNSVSGRIKRFADRFYALEKMPILSAFNYPNEKDPEEKTGADKDSAESAAAADAPEHADEAPAAAAVLPEQHEQKAQEAERYEPR
ncbi:MAG: NYN domain-containing protein [Methanomethylophilus sp.]|nr:NYN domain-containing protein [Methanomethylophilus sp.]WII09862.1 NYN domain-containing protein [Methanomassiliicoccales archaeon LGM-DZ1]